MRHSSSVTVVAASLLAAACGGPVEQSQLDAEPHEDAGPPSIVLVVGDGPNALAGGAADIADHGIRFTKMSSVGPASRGSVRSALLTGLPPAALGFQRGDKPRREAEPTDHLTAVPPPEVRIFPELLRRAGYLTVRRGRAVHNLSVGVPDTAAEPGQPGLLGAWDVAGPDANWRRTLGEPCTASFGCGPVLVDLLPGQDNIVEFDAPFFMLVNAAHSSRSDVDRVFAELEADGLADDTIVLTLEIGEDDGSVAMAWPGRWTGGAVRDEPVSVLDIAPTVLSLAGVSVPAYMNGHALVGLDGEAPTSVADASVAKSAVQLQSLPWAEEVPPVAAAPDGRPTGGLFHVAPIVRLRCDTEGSTIVYTTELVEPFYWRLYIGPFRMRFWTLRFQCGRLGHLDSEVVAYEFDIE